MIRCSGSKTYPVFLPLRLKISPTKDDPDRPLVRIRIFEGTIFSCLFHVQTFLGVRNLGINSILHFKANDAEGEHRNKYARRKIAHSRPSRLSKVKPTKSGRVFFIASRLLPLFLI